MKSNMSTYKNYYFISALILLVIFLSTCSSKEDSTTESTTSDLTWPKAKGCDYSVSDLKTVLLQMELEKSISRVSHFLIVQLRCNFNRIFT